MCETSARVASFTCVRAIKSACIIHNYPREVPSPEETSSRDNDDDDDLTFPNVGISRGRFCTFVSPLSRREGGEAFCNPVAR